MIDPLYCRGFFIFTAMAFPFFYFTGATGDTNLILDEETSKHVIQVLRMKEGESLNLTDGKGLLLTTQITDGNRKRCGVVVRERVSVPVAEKKAVIAISLLKNSKRFEWFLEKATELGIYRIIPLLCQRTEKEKFREERLQQILVSAMLQSQQAWLPLMGEPVPYAQIFEDPMVKNIPDKFIAHCEDTERKSLKDAAMQGDKIILIGPEGDFSHEEIDLALRHNFKPVILGPTRLRTETAGLYAAVIMK